MDTKLSSFKSQTDCKICSNYPVFIKAVISIWTIAWRPYDEMKLHRPFRVNICHFDVKCFPRTFQYKPFTVTGIIYFVFFCRYINGLCRQSVVVSFSQIEHSRGWESMIVIIFSLIIGDCYIRWDCIFLSTSSGYSFSYTIVIFNRKFLGPHMHNGCEETIPIPERDITYSKMQKSWCLRIWPSRICGGVIFVFFFRFIDFMNLIKIGSSISSWMPKWMALHHYDSCCDHHMTGLEMLRQNTQMHCTNALTLPRFLVVWG